MTINRRTLLAAAAAALAGGTQARAADLPVVRVGVLRFGTVSWEMDVVRRHGLDTAAGVKVQAVSFASSPATQVALQAHDVDVTVQDWLWVARQRAEGADFTFAPFSDATGALIVPPDSPIRSVADLRGKRLGIAGSPIDKSWLLLRAYAQSKFGLDLQSAAQPSYGAPPLISQQLEAGRIDAALTFWPFAARAQAAGMRRVLAVEELLDALGIGGNVPVTGYVFSEAWATKNRPALTGFLAAARRARDLLATSDAEWQAIRPATGATSDAELALLRDYFRHGIPRHWGKAEIEAAERMYAVLSGVGGTALVGSAKTIAPGTFWQAETL